MKELDPPSKTSAIPAERTDPGPIVKFSHLASAMTPEASDDFLHPLYGFSTAEEENLYTTGYLQRFFLRC
ncbi:MAG: hypothetical protein PHQ63_10000 [Smithellaceae bacterium]|jgi:hypothetical protein|nr:hypothetical protein [Smithellaceae bacterium]